jgi:septation ring formation regulator EzrA
MNIHDAYNNISSALENSLSQAHAAIPTMSTRHQQVAPHLNKYMEHAAMSGHFFSAAHADNNYAEASHHLENVQEAMKAMHQVAHYQTGPISALTKSFATTMPKFHAAADNYREAAGTNAPALGNRFEDIMKNNNINPQQFS